MLKESKIYDGFNENKKIITDNKRTSVAVTNTNDILFRRELVPNPSTLSFQEMTQSFRLIFKHL